MSHEARYICAAVLAGAVLGGGSTAFGAGFQETTQSGTAVGMANAGVANPDEPNSSFYNPAATVDRDGIQAYVGATLIYPLFDYQPFGARGDAGHVDTDHGLYPLPNIHLGYAVNDDFSVAIGLGSPYGLTVNWPNNWRGREVNEFVQLESYIVNPTLSYAVADTGLSVAVGPQLAYNFVELHRDIRLSDNQFVQTELGGDGFGFGGLVAVMYRPTDRWTFGAQYRSRTNVDYDDADVHFRGEENTPFRSTFQDNPAATDITLPDLISVGAGYRWNDLFVQLQVDYTLWTSFESIDVDIDTGGDEDALPGFELKEDWDNSWTFRVGGQYDVTPHVPVRLGIAYDRSPIPDDTVSAVLPGNHRIEGSLGAGYKWADRWRVDAAYQLVEFLERDIRNDEGPRGGYNGTAHVVGIDIGYGY